MPEKTEGDRESKSLVRGYLERIPSTIFYDFPQQLTDLVGTQHGVYALYKGNRLYYIGLATDLRNRIKGHLRDRHVGKWNKFSLYLVRKADQIKEIESLILRMADPTGNAVKGQLPRAENLKLDLRSMIKKAQGRQLDRLFEKKGASRKVPRIKTTGTRARIARQPPLSPYVKKRFKIRGTLKGITYEATVRANGKVDFQGKIFNSPSMAASAAIGRPSNGWSFWRFKNKKGEWVKLDELRK